MLTQGARVQLTNMGALSWMDVEMLQTVPNPSLVYIPPRAHTFPELWCMGGGEGDKNSLSFVLNIV